MNTKLSPLHKDHPVRRIGVCNRKTRKRMFAHGDLAGTRYPDYSDQQNNIMGEVCEEVTRDTAQLETLVASAAADGEFTPDECDAIIAKVREINTEIEEGRVIPG